MFIRILFNTFPTRSVGCCAFVWCFLSYMGACCKTLCEIVKFCEIHSSLLCTEQIVLFTSLSIISCHWSSFQYFILNISDNFIHKKLHWTNFCWIDLQWNSIPSDPVDALLTYVLVDLSTGSSTELNPSSLTVIVCPLLSTVRIQTLESGVFNCSDLPVESAHESKT